MKKDKINILKKLFFSTLYLSAFTFGGGYVIVTLLREKFVHQYGWIDEEEMLDLIAIAQSSPGAIAVNGAIVVGYRLASIPGVIVSVLGSIIPPMVIISLISVFYGIFRDNLYVSALLGGMTAGVGAVITSVVYDMTKGLVKAKDPINLCLMVIAFLASYFGKVNVALIILLTALFGLIRTILTERRRKNA